jgi:hypothetical protein
MILITILTGCAFGNKGTFQYNRTTTIGRELIDLQQAKEEGAITEEDYDRVKKEILKGGPFNIKDHLKK